MLKKDSQKHIRSYFMSNDAYQRYVRSVSSLGRCNKTNGEESLFSISKQDADKITKKCRGNIDYFERKLGIPIGQFDRGPIHRVDINFPYKYNLRYATGYELGANCFWNTYLSEREKAQVKFITEGNQVLVIKNYSYPISYKTGCAATIEINGIVYEIIDSEQTSSRIISKIKGRYVTSSGIIHEPDATGYEGATSGSILEMVTDRINNCGKEVNHFTYFGGHRSSDKIKKSFIIEINLTATNDSVRIYMEKVGSIDISTSEGRTELKKLQKEAWDNIYNDREWISNASPEDKKAQGYPVDE